MGEKRKERKEPLWWTVSIPGGKRRESSEMEGLSVSDFVFLQEAPVSITFPPSLMISTANGAGSVRWPRGWCRVERGPAPHVHAPGQAPAIPVCIFQAAQPLHI